MANALLARLVKSSEDNATLPPKPYTEYTIFFRLERTYLLQSSGIIDEEVVSSLDPTHYDPVEFPRPARYEPLALPPYWYSSSHKAAIEKKRKHRKRAGRMDLKTLSKTISASWRKADPVVVDYCRKLAKAELEKYNKTIEGIMKDQDEKAPDVGVTGGVRQQQKLSKLKVCSGTGSGSGSGVMTNNTSLSPQDFVFAQAKQQDNPAVMMQRPAVKVAPEVKSNGTLSLVFSKPKQVTNTAVPISMPVAAPPITANNNMNSLRDKVNQNAEISMSMSVVTPPITVSNNMNRLRDRVNQNSAMPMPMATPVTVSKNNMSNLRGSFNYNGAMSLQVATPPVTVSNNMKSLRDSFNEVMGYSSNRPQINQRDQTVLQLLQLQAAQIPAQQQKVNLRGDASPTSIKSSSPFLTNDGGVRHQDRPEKKNKRKFVRRATAPPDYLIHGNLPARPHTGGNNGVVTYGDAGRAYAFLGEDGPTKMKRRSSMVNMASRETSRQGLHLTAEDLRELKSIRRAGLAAAQELSDSFQKELDNGRFTHVPKWGKEDADELLDILNVPQVSEPMVADKPESLMDEEMRMFMEDVSFPNIQ